VSRQHSSPVTITESTSAVAPSASSFLGALHRAGRVTAGMVFLGLGIVMLPLPGPGTAIIVGALVFLSRDVAWARRLVDVMKRQLEQATPASLRGTRASRVAYAAFGTVSAVLAASMFWLVR
jgi:uncharacterized protein (TIGR02611 family)